jgi:hypothetical protein
MCAYVYKVLAYRQVQVVGGAERQHRGGAYGLGIRQDPPWLGRAGLSHPFAAARICTKA